MKKVPKRFDRTARLIGEVGMRALQGSRIAVFGLGGVGSYAAEALARTGVGHMHIVDFDEVCLTNFNRQLHAVEGAIGKKKAELMAERLLSIYPELDLDVSAKFYEKETSEELLNPAPDVVLDCIDNVTAKLHLIASCVDKGIPVVTCLGAAAKLDPTRIREASLLTTHSDRLGRVVRKYLRRHYKLTDEALASVMAIFSDEGVLWPDADYKGTLCGVECVCPGGANSHHNCQDRNVIHGSVAFVTGAFGMAAASAAVRLLLQNESA